ncbi:MAG TPA: hypothetical protein VKX49_28405 [Bryobacteraceae bacterium]|nr:hypothetical protein [Bryobacteraceae bacterium]
MRIDPSRADAYAALAAVYAGRGALPFGRIMTPLWMTRAIDPLVASKLIFRKQPNQFGSVRDVEN